MLRPMSSGGRGHGCAPREDDRLDRAGSAGQGCPFAHSALRLRSTCLTWRALQPPSGAKRMQPTPEGVGSAQGVASIRPWGAARSASMPHLVMRASDAGGRRVSARRGKHPSLGRGPFGIHASPGDARIRRRRASDQRAHHQPMYWPPLIARFAPVIQRARSSTKKPTAKAISSGSPKRPTGICATILLRTSSGTAITMSVPT